MPSCAHLSLLEGLDQKLVDLAQAARPHEACGLLVGSRSAAGVRIEAVRSLENREANRPELAFRIAPEDWVREEQSVRLQGQEVVGIWHSHPTGPAVPSARDLRVDLGSFLSLIVGRVDGTWQLRCWTLQGTQPLEVRLERQPSSYSASTPSGASTPKPQEPRIPTRH